MFVVTFSKVNLHLTNIGIITHLQGIEKFKKAVIDVTDGKLSGQVY